MSQPSTARAEAQGGDSTTPSRGWGCSDSGGMVEIGVVLRILSLGSH